MVILKNNSTSQPSNSGAKTPHVTLPNVEQSLKRLLDYDCMIRAGTKIENAAPRCCLGLLIRNLSPWNRYQEYRCAFIGQQYLPNRKIYRIGVWKSEVLFDSRSSGPRILILDLSSAFWLYLKLGHSLPYWQTFWLSSCAYHVTYSSLIFHLCLRPSL